MSTDSFQNLIDYVKQVKPYHTQLLDVVLEYACSETVAATVSEQYSTEVVIASIPQDILSRNGYGLSWDSSDYDTATHPIVSSVRREECVVVFAPSSTTITVIGTMSIIAGDEVTFETTSLPPSYSSGSVIGQVFRVLSVTGSGFTCCLPDSPTTPILWTSAGTGTMKAIIVSRGVNMVKVTLPSPSAVAVTVVSLYPAEVLMAQPRTIIAANSTLNQFTISGNHISEFSAGQQVYVRGNTFPLANKTYTVVSASLVSSNTVVTVVESVLGGTTSTGKLMIPTSASVINVWPYGSQVKIPNGASGVGLSSSATYFVTPISVGRFQLSLKSDSLITEEFSRLTALDVGDMTVECWIASPIGSAITLNGTLTNDGTYTVMDVSRTGNSLSVTVMPDLVSNEFAVGTVSFGDNGFGSASKYDQPIANDEMRANGSVSDSITFELV